MSDNKQETRTDMELYIGDLMGEVIDVIARLGEEDYIGVKTSHMLMELAIELAEQLEEDVESHRRAKEKGI